MSIDIVEFSNLKKLTLTPSIWKYIDAYDYALGDVKELPERFRQKAPRLEFLELRICTHGLDPVCDE